MRPLQDQGPPLSDSPHKSRLFVVRRGSPVQSRSLPNKKKKKKVERFTSYTVIFKACLLNIPLPYNERRNPLFLKGGMIRYGINPSRTLAHLFTAISVLADVSWLLKINFSVNNSTWRVNILFLCRHQTRLALYDLIPEQSVLYRCVCRV